jgi:hypothetical protein
MGLNSVSDIKETIKEIFENSLSHSQKFEDKLKTVPSKIVELEHICDAFILGYVSILAEKIDLAAVQGYLESNEVYQKLKDQDISPLLDFPPTEDPKEIVQWVENKIRALEDFLRPLDLPNYDAYIELVFSIINKALHIQETASDDPAELYQEILATGIQDDLHQLTVGVFLGPIGLPNAEEHGELVASIFNKALHASEIVSDDPVKAYEVLETSGLHDDLYQLTDLPYNEFEGEHPLALEFPKDITSAIHDLEQLLEYIEHLDADTISHILHDIIIRLIPANMLVYETEIENIVKFIVTEVKKINFSQPTQFVVRDIVQELAKLSAHYSTEHPRFSTFNTVLQRISAVICYIVDHNLLTTIQIKKMKEGDELIPDKPAKGVFPEYKKKKDSKSSNQQAIILYDNDVSEYIDIDQILNYLLEMAMAQLDEKTRDFAQRLMDGSAFTEVGDIFDGFLLNLEHSATEAWEVLEAVLLASAPNPLSSLVTTFFEQLKKIVDAIFSGIDDLVKKLIGLVSELAQFVVNLVLGIKVPVQPFDSVPVLKDISGINIPCYLVALPWETFRHFHHSNNGFNSFES